MGHYHRLVKCHQELSHQLIASLHRAGKLRYNVSGLPFMRSGPPATELLPSRDLSPAAIAARLRS